MAQVSVAKPLWLGTAFGQIAADCSMESADSPPAASKLNGSGKRSFRHYRRSTQCKAPRKRTFVMHMSKYTDGLLPRQDGTLNGCGFPFKAHAFIINDDDLEQNPADYGSGGAGHGRDPNLVSSHRVQTARFLLSRDMAVLAAAAALRPALLALHLSATQLVCTAARLHTALGQQRQLEQQQQHQERHAAQQRRQQDAAALAPPCRSQSPSPSPPTRKRRSPFQAALQAAAHTSTPSPTPPTSDPTAKRPRAASPVPPATPPPTHDAFLRATLGHPAAPALPDLTLGDLLGAGAHGNVYSGTWAGHPAAIKLATHPTPAPTAPPTPSASAAVASLSREARLLPTFSHPNIVACLHAAPAPDSQADNNTPAPAADPASPNPLLILELLPNGSLDSHLHGPRAPAARAALLPCILARHARHAPALPTPTPAAHRLVLLSLLRDAAAALHHIHTCPAPVVHRDLKPENILVSATGAAKLSDFGVAVVLGPNPAAPLHPAFAAAADVFGTVQYSAPEDLWGVGSNGGTRVAPAADVYSLGCVLWEVLAGRRPWDGLDTVQVMYGVGSGGKRLPVDEAAWPADLVALMRACWQADPALRPTAEQAGEVLGRHVAALAAQVARSG